MRLIAGTPNSSCRNYTNRAVAFFMERHGLPTCRKLRRLDNAAQAHQSQRRLAHASRPHDQQVLAGPVRRLFGYDAEQFGKLVASGDEGDFEFFAR